MSRHNKLNFCRVCGKSYRPCVGCFSENIAITPRKYTCSNVCFVDYVLMEKGESNLIRIVLKSDGNAYIVEKINKRTIKLTNKTELIKANEILAITYCPIDSLQELSEWIKNNTKEEITNE